MEKFITVFCPRTECRFSHVRLFGTYQLAGRIGKGASGSLKAIPSETASYGNRGALKSGDFVVKYAVDVGITPHVVTNKDWQTHLSGDGYRAHFSDLLTICERSILHAQ